MKKTLAIALMMLLSVLPSRLLAKSATTKVVIEGPGLSRPIEITDRRILANFNVWAGPGTSSSQPGFNPNAPSFIIDWSYGPITEVPNVSQKYQVSFYTKELSERPIYVVYYAVARSSEPGYVYLSGESEEWWRLNVTSILRGVEGKWFHAWSTWENIARPLIKKREQQIHPTRLSGTSIGTSPRSVFKLVKFATRNQLRFRLVRTEDAVPFGSNRQLGGRLRNQPESSGFAAVTPSATDWQLCQWSRL